VAEPFEYRLSLPPLAVAVSWAAATSVGDSIYVIGGCVGDVVDDGPTLSSVQIYDVDTGDVTFGTRMPKGVSGAAFGAGPDGKIYVAGGWNVSDGDYYQRVQIYDPALDSWTEAVGDVPSPIGRSASAMSPDGMLYVFGGGWTSNVTLIYDTQTDVWRNGTDLPSWGLDADAVVVSPTQVFLIGDGSSDVRVYNPVADEWSSVASLPISLGWASAVLGRNGDIFVFGGSSSSYSDPAPLSSVLRYSVLDDVWEYSDSTLSSGRTSSCAVLDYYGRAVVLGGYDGSSVVANVEAFVTSEITGEYLIQISSPQHGSIVSGVVEVQVDPINSWGSGFPAVDLFVDGVLYESRSHSYGTTFLWNTTGLPDGSTHTLMARGYNWDGSVVEDSVTVTVWSVSVEERMAAMEQQISLLQIDLDSLTASVGAMQTDIDALQSQLSSLQTQLNALKANQTTQGAKLDQLQTQLNEMQDSLDKVKTTSNSGSMWGMVNLVLLIVVIALLAMMFMMSRKKP
jgi:N-acetylneuraminic acid mutarotase/uncharacterized coiled-coil protein SlyX